MALATQCPHCYTSFRVANDQLKLHAGMVRCGACKQTFNGIEHLLAPGEAPRTPPQNSTQDEVVSTDASTQGAAQAVSESRVEHSPAESIVDSNNTSPEQTHDANAHSAIGVAQAEKVAQIDTGYSFQTEEESTPVPEEFADYLSEQDLSNIASTEVETSTDQWHQSLEHQSGETPVDIMAANEYDDAELTPSQQELDDIALFQEKLASFAAMAEAPPPAVDRIDIENAITGESSIPQATITENDGDQSIAEQYTSQLEIIEQEEYDSEAPTTEVDEETVAPTTKESNKRGTLTASLDFELSDEERSWQESVQASQIEVETKAAISATEDSAYSRHEPSFADTNGNDDNLEHDLHALLTESPAPSQTTTSHTKTPTKPPAFVASPSEPTVSITDTEHELTQDEDDQPDFMLKAERARKYSKLQLAGLWLAILTLGTLATAQTVFLMRSSIAAHYPSSKPQLQKLCSQLGCEIKLPTQIEQIVVEGTELNTLTQDPHILVLSVQLQNKSTMIQAWPMLELILKDSRGKTVLQRVFRPEEYLENKTHVAKGIAAHSENAFKLHFELSTMKAANYAVEVFYP